MTLSLAGQLNALICMGLVMAGCGSLRAPLVTDVSHGTSSERRSLDLVFYGCGQPAPTVGYLFCPLAEGTDPRAVTVSVILPSATCRRQTCSKVQFLNRDARPGFGVSAASASDSVIRFTLADVIGSALPLSVGDEGEWQAMGLLWWTDAGGVERMGRADGLLRLWVMSEKAVALRCQDPEIGWVESIGRTRVIYSTSMRSTVCEARP